MVITFIWCFLINSFSIGHIDVHGYVTTIYNKILASRNGPAAPLLARPVFLKVKMKFDFYKK